MRKRRGLAIGLPLDAKSIKAHFFCMAGPEFRPPNPIVLDDAVREHLGQQLRGVYSDLLASDLPKDLGRLIGLLDSAIQIRLEPPNPGFVEDLLKATRHLRAFALSLTHDVDRAEDLVQSTLLRAYDKRNRFEPDTCLQAWLFTILKNDFHTEYRKRRREVADSEGAYAASLIALPEQTSGLEMQDLSEALAKLPERQREALLLAGAEGMSYEDIAARQHVSVGTTRAGSTEPATTWQISSAWDRRTPSASGSRTTGVGETSKGRGQPSEHRSARASTVTDSG